MRRIPAPLRFLLAFVPVVLVFGICGSLTLGAMDKFQTAGQYTYGHQPALLSNLWGYTIHFIGAFIGVLTTGHDKSGVPFRNFFIYGTGLTVTFCFLAMPLALLLGFVLAQMSRSQRRILWQPARAYIEFFRNTPFIVQMVAINTSLVFLPPSFLNAFTVGLATLVLNYAAYESENLRGGIIALDRGQTEAATALGLSGWQSLRLIVVPQMIPVVLPPVINDLIYMFKDSSILSLISVQELTAQGTNSLPRRASGLSWQFYLITACIYLLLSLPLGTLARWAEARIKSAVAAPKRDLAVLALQVLGVMFVAGWICGVFTYFAGPIYKDLGPVLAAVFKHGAIGTSISQLIAGVVLTLLIMLFALVVLGAVIYVPSSIVGLVRGKPPAHVREAMPLPVASK
ncbi:MAG: amino acid ABC transporter permease [Ktedonobacterales bacterium]